MSAEKTVQHTITNKLREAFAPESNGVTDESHLHEGHAGHRPGGETHFRVYIVSPAFEGKSRIGQKHAGGRPFPHVIGTGVLGRSDRSRAVARWPCQGSNGHRGL